MAARRQLATAAALLCAALAAAGAGERGDAGGWRAREVRRFSAEEARQGVAADALHVYAIDDRRIGKYAKATGRRVAAWSAPEGDDAIVHLNAGVVADGRLVCAHSNYPALPMRSSLEIFDAATLAHVASRPLEIADGSATWALPEGKGYWVAFANYAGRGGAPGRGPEASFVALLDAALRPQRRLSFPDAVVRRMGRHASSGASFGPDGLLFATGHDAPELWVLRAPAAGEVLELVAVVPAPIAGQGVAFDPAEPDVLWAVRRGSREIVALRIAAPPGAGR